MLIYKIFRPSEWADLERRGQTDGTADDLADGFIHFSTAGQLPQTAARHFADIPDLILAAAASDRFGDALRWEISRGGACFPHLYRPLARGDFAWAVPLPLGSGGHVFPDPLP